tara:strand:- start:12 stop:362 length:351 start_codon:yes stop_codon:yes gene_type:complete
MAATYWKIAQYLISKGKTEAEAKELFDNRKIILLKPFDEPERISNWDVTGITEPTTGELDAVDADATTAYNNNRTRKTRKKAYGNIGDQLDEIYHNIDDWKAKIKAVKEKFPKENN